jgi:hypothetical protein
MLKACQISVLVFGFLICGSQSLAQQTIINVPSADVTPAGKLFLQHESQYRWWKPGQYWFGTHYAALGIGHNTELDCTLFNVTSPASNNISLGVGFKKIFPILPKRLPEEELKLVVGEMVPISLEGQSVGNWTYVEGSFRLPRLHTRITAGVSTGTKQIFFDNMVCFLGGIEQPITKKLTAFTEWYSGTHTFGYLIPGFSYSLPLGLNFYCGYQIPNSLEVSRSGLVMEMSKIIPLGKKR